MKSSAIGSLPILTGGMWIPWTGAWVLDAELDCSSTDPLPSGKVTPNVSDATLKGTIDPRSTIRFGEKAHARVIAGGGAWSNTPAPRTFHNDGGVSSQTVIQATANDIGETANVPSPVTVGVDYIRLGRDPKTGKGIDAPASRVLEPYDWHVDANGVTQIAPWPPLTPDPDALVLEFDPEDRRLDIAATAIVWPGTVFTDSRFGTMIVRDVDLKIEKDSFRITAWCAGAASSRYAAALKGSVREYAQTDYGKLIRYRISKNNTDGRIFLQASDPNDGFPDTLPISVWPGMAGFYADFVTGTEVLVEFLGRSPSNPIVRGFAPPDVTKTSRIALAPPVQAHVDALVAFAAQCGNAVNPQVSEIKAAAIALYNLLTGVPGVPPPTPPYNASKPVQTLIARAQ